MIVRSPNKPTFVYVDDGVIWEATTGCLIDYNLLVRLREVANNLIKEYTEDELLSVRREQLEQVYARNETELSQASQQEHQAPELTFVYLMEDTNTGAFKIGYSKHPTHRERTLQAEKPSIRLLNTWPGTWELEQELHSLYADKRIRGEWFKLDADDIRHIQIFMLEKGGAG